jgi:hypothetical protein
MDVYTLIFSLDIFYSTRNFFSSKKSSRRISAAPGTFTSQTPSSILSTLPEGVGIHTDDMLLCRYSLGVVVLSPRVLVAVSSCRLFTNADPQAVLERAVHSYPKPSRGDRPLGFFPSHKKRFVAIRVACISLHSCFIGLSHQMNPADLRINNRSLAMVLESHAIEVENLGRKVSICLPNNTD